MISSKLGVILMLFVASTLSFRSSINSKSKNFRSRISDIDGSNIEEIRNSLLIERVDEEVISQQAIQLQTFPLELYEGFEVVAVQAVLRSVFIIVTAHCMLLLPALKYIKFGLHTDIGPFLLIGPVLGILPFIVFWLWELDIIDFNLIDDLMRRYVRRYFEEGALYLKREESGLLKQASREMEILLKIRSDQAIGNTDGSVVTLSHHNSSSDHSKNVIPSDNDIPSTNANADSQLITTDPESISTPPPQSPSQELPLAISFFPLSVTASLSSVLPSDAGFDAEAVGKLASLRLLQGIDPDMMAEELLLLKRRKAAVRPISPMSSLGNLSQMYTQALLRDKREQAQGGGEEGGLFRWRELEAAQYMVDILRVEMTDDDAIKALKGFRKDFEEIKTSESKKALSRSEDSSALVIAEVIFRITDEIDNFFRNSFKVQKSPTLT